MHCVKRSGWHTRMSSSGHDSRAVDAIGDPRSTGARRVRLDRVKIQPGALERCAHPRLQATTEDHVAALTSSASIRVEHVTAVIRARSGPGHTGAEAGTEAAVDCHGPGPIGASIGCLRILGCIRISGPAG